jgi:DNA-binding NarL/FixJ family response regulator
MLKVLIVEDNQIFREAFKKRLNDNFPSMAVREASNGDEALQKVG